MTGRMNGIEHVPRVLVASCLHVFTSYGSTALLQVFILLLLAKMPWLTCVSQKVSNADA